MIRPNTPEIRCRRLTTVCYCLALALSPFATPALLSQTGADRQREIQAHVQKAQEALKSRNPAVAEAEFRAILNLDPNNTDALGNVGVLRFFQGDWAGAAEQFRQILKAQPSLWKAQALLGICEKRLGHPGEAQHLLEESLPHLNDGALRLQAGLELVEIPYRSGDLDKATEIVGALERANPMNVDVLYTAYRIHADLANRARDALALVAPDSSRMHETMAQHLVNEGDLSGAIAQYRKALAIDPRLRGIHHELAEAILKDSRSDAPPALNIGPGGFENEIVLSDEFFREITAHSIPTDLEAAKALSSSPAAPGSIHVALLPLLHSQRTREDTILRKVLGSDASVWIQTVPKHGYKRPY